MACSLPQQIPSRNLTVYFFPEGSIVLSRPSSDKELHIDLVKNTVAECCNLSQESLGIFGIFLGSLKKPMYLLTDTVPEDATEISMLRLSLDPNKEAEIVGEDITARFMIFHELKFYYESGFLLPIPEGETKERINKLLCNAANSECEVIQIISRNYFTYTSRNYVVTCQRNLAIKPTSLSTDIVPIRVAMGPKEIVFFDISGEHVLIHWPWSNIVCFRYSQIYMKLIVLYIFVEDLMKKILRPIFINTLFSDYLRTVSLYMDKIQREMNDNAEVPGRTIEFQQEMFIGSRQYRGNDYPYHTRPYLIHESILDIRVENYLDIIAVDMYTSILQDKIQTSNNSILSTFLLRTPGVVYIPRCDYELEVTEEIQIRPLTLINKDQNKELKIQFLVYCNKTIAATQVLNSLGTFYCLPSSEKPEHVFQLYHLLENGVVKWLRSYSEVDDSMDTVYFSDIPPNTLTVNTKSLHPSKLMGIMQSLQLLNNKNAENDKSRDQICDHSLDEHPLQESYCSPPVGFLAPSNTPEHNPITPESNPSTPESSPVKNGHHSLACDSRNPFKLLQKVAEKLSGLLLDSSQSTLGKKVVYY